MKFRNFRPARSLGTPAVRLGAILLAGLFLLIQPARPIHAVEIPVTGACTLIDAILAANGDQSVGGCPAGQGLDILILANNGTYNLTARYADTASGLPSITTPITIRGQGSTIMRDESLRCRENDSFRIIHVAATGMLTLENVTVQNGCVDEDNGGGIYNEGGQVTLRQSRITGNEADSGSFNDANGNGGGIYQNGPESSLVVENGSAVAGNYARQGGGIYIGGGQAQVVNSQIEANEASSAAALYNAGSQVRIQASRVISNIAFNTGGSAIVQAGGTLLITEQSFIARNEEGGIYNGGGSVQVEASQIADNTDTAISSFGANSIVTLTAKSLISGNDSGIENFAGRVYVLDSQIMDQRDSIEEGLLNVDGEAVVRFSEISGNAGTGIWNQNGYVLIEDSHIANNQGRGLVNNIDAHMEIHRSQIVRNRTLSQGAGIYNSAGGSGTDTSFITITHSLIAYNQANSSSGGIENDGAHLLIQHSHIIGNQAAWSGGGIYSGPSFSSAVLIIEDSVIRDNVAAPAPDQGGGLYIAIGERTEIVRSCIIGNSDIAVYATGVTGALPILAENNWWGADNGPSATGPGNGDSVSTLVDFEPFLESCPLALGTGSFMPAIRR